jgi:hypothetical protein
MAKLLDGVRDRVRVLHDSIRTEDAWVRCPVEGTARQETRPAKTGARSFTGCAVLATQPGNR